MFWSAEISSKTNQTGDTYMKKINVLVAGLTLAVSGSAVAVSFSPLTLVSKRVV